MCFVLFLNLSSSQHISLTRFPYAHSRTCVHPTSQQVNFSRYFRRRRPGKLTSPFHVTAPKAKGKVGTGARSLTTAAAPPKSANPIETGGFGEATKTTRRKMPGSAGGEGKEDDVHRKQLVAFYAQHNPAKLKNVDTLLAKHKGEESTLFAILQDRYVKEKTSTAEDAVGGGDGESGEKKDGEEMEAATPMTMCKTTGNTV